MKPRLFFALLAGASLSLSAGTLQERILMADTLIVSPESYTLVNPALAGYRLPVSISRIDAGFEQQGGVTRRGYFDARTYIQSKNSTIEGHASYRNGFRLNSGIYENANPELLYPYLTADEVGGRLDDEIYSFGGAYNTSLADSTWLIGVEGAYTALLECRRRDPRPKNTVGDLNARLGGAFRLGTYWLGASISGRKYKQTNDISFVSEIGESKIYHTIGLGAHYSRFAGSSRNSSYSGSGFGAGLNLFPVENLGAFASVDFNRFSFNKILTNLNRLPLASANENALSVQAGWRSGNFALSANFASFLRKGKENIFGEPMGNVYPEIATLTTFSSRNLRTGISAAYSLLTSLSRWSFAVEADYAGSTMKYLGFATPRQMKINHFTPCLNAQWVRALSQSVTLQAGASGMLELPSSTSLEGVPSERNFMEESTTAEYSWLSARKGTFGLNIGIDVNVSRTIAVGVRAAAGQTYIADHNSQTNYNCSICMIF